MPRQPVAMKPQDVCLALQLSLTPDVGFRQIAESLAMSVGEAHNSAQRLRDSQIVLVSRLGVNPSALVEFLVHGVSYVFPGVLGPKVRGVPTAHSGPPLAEHFSPADPIVWPYASGSVRGALLLPLCPSAPKISEANPELYCLLTLVDALRVGHAREKKVARDLLESSILKNDL